jgi:DNA-binding CsgD family transcriptional regulator/tetratricopeptide (TPR) repeat protein
MTLSSLSCPTSIGREAPLQALVDHLDRAVSGTGAVVHVGGDAGIGKSRLMRDLKQQAVSRDVRVIEGRCTSTESSVPYAPLMNALRFRIAKGEGEAVAEMLGPLRSVLAPIFPQLTEKSAADPAHVDRERERPFELIFAVLERLAAEDTMLLVLEDVHWADPTSLELLHHLAHRAPEFRMLLVATYRTDELHAAHPLRRLLGSLARDRVGAELHLDPLSPDQITEMLRRTLGAEPDPSFASAIWRRAEGNPFFVEELLSVLAGSGKLEPSAHAAAILERAPLPSTVSEAVVERANSLGPAAVETLAAASVIGRSFDFEDLRSVLGMSELELLEVLEQLVAHQLLREDKLERKDSYSFPHALMQEAMYESLISRRRRLLHRRAAIALEKRVSRTPSRLDELAFHFRLGGDHERAWNYSRLAGDEAVRLRAWDDAGAHYENALASLEEMADESDRAADLIERLAAIAWRRSKSAEAAQYTEEALRLRRALGDNEAAARLLRRTASLRIDEGDTEGAGEALDEALRILGETPDSSQLGAIYDDLGKLSLDRGELDRAETLLMQGLSLASKDTATAEEVPALVSLGELSILGGAVSAGVSRLDLALALLREGRLPFERLMRVYSESVRVLLLAQDYRRALTWADSAIALCRRQSVVGLDASFRAMRAVILTITSGEEDTLTQAQSAVDELRRTGRSELRDALRMLGFIHRARGELDEARSAYEEASSLGDRGRQVGLALVAMAQGRNEEAAGILEAALQAVPPSQPLFARQLLPYAVEALIAVDRIDDAQRCIETIAPLPDPTAGLAQLHHAMGLLRLAQEKPGEAREELEIAAKSWDETGNRLEARRARVALLEAMLLSGAGEDGLALGRQLLEELGRPLLPREREMVRRVLRRAGIRTRPTPAVAPDTPEERSVLTTREQAVLREVAEGRTNREIAASLGIAEKTVSVHVSHILAKLGCKTRTQAARFAVSEIVAN